MIGETSLKPITLGKTRTLKDIEAAIRKICDRAGERFLIQADMLSARRGAMHDAARLQLIVTLARQQLQNDYLDFNPQADVQKLLNNLGNCSPGIAAVRLSKGVRLGEQTFNRRAVFQESVERMQAMDAGRYEDVVSGRVVDLICVAGSKVQHLRPLFHGTGQVKLPFEMADEMRNLIDFVNKQTGRTSVPESLIDSLGLFCSELISNTQQHATSDHLGRPYIAHVEGIMVGWRRLEDDIFSEDFNGSEDLRRYWQRESSTTDNNKTSLRALHISIFDSGPGFASRMSGKLVQDMSLPEERGHLLTCLQRRQSSKPQDAAGVGLPDILTELRKVGGLIRIRSGRLCIYNQFEENDQQRDLLDFRDWDSTGLAPVAGAVVTIMIPLRGM
ncbi:hypothetical protein [Pseudomonas aeruginosa]|uniref:hypothetical protein n=1 Tax=Pseudomonas aeruginosa TaxID=287 RepID=UPI00295BEDD8|nr:hypothetical protein [Pseudomonas aeruginosa]